MTRRDTPRNPLNPRLSAGVWSAALGVGGLALSAVSISGASAVSTNFARLDPPAFPETSFSVLRVFGALTFVIALFLAGVWLFRNWQRVTRPRGRPPQLQVLESRTLGARQALHVVGYQEQRLLLASSPAGITLVSHLPGDLPPSPAATAVPDRPGAKVDPDNFVRVLQQAIQQKR